MRRQPGRATQRHAVRAGPSASIGPEARRDVPHDPSTCRPRARPGRPRRADAGRGRRAGGAVARPGRVLARAPHAARRHPREDRRRLQRVAGPVPGQPDLQGLVPGHHGGGHRRLSGRQRPPRRADVRGRHRHHDVGARRHQARARADAGHGGRLRPQHLPARGARILQPARRADDGDAVQQLDGHHVLQQGRLQEGGPRPRQAAADLARADRVRPQDQGGRRGAVRLHHGVADVDAVRAVQRHPRRAPRHQGQRHGRARRRAQDQQRPPRAARAGARGHAEGGHVQVRRARRRRRRPVPLGGVRHHPRLVRPPRPHRPRGQVRLGGGHAAVLAAARPARPRTRSSAGPPSG